MMLLQAQGLDETEDLELLERSHECHKVPESLQTHDLDTGGPEDDPLDNKFTKGQDFHTLAQEHYHSLINVQLVQSLDQTNSRDIVIHCFQDGELSLQCKELKLGVVITNLSFEGYCKDMPDSLARYIRDKGVGRCKNNKV